MENTKLTDFGKELGNKKSKKLEQYSNTLAESRKRLEKVIKEGTKKSDFESYTSCLKAVCSAISFLDRMS
ncbi:MULTISPECIES: hypothetical protein [Candidatus Ichthyocystis]|uniref:hypothetical protein n=1 Tax=Candidatus Ichthyocystis TaxID=2929841 RepID=UPI000B872791|nr:MULTISPECIES: hypothetical protein [Ichthyocystis]